MTQEQTCCADDLLGSTVEHKAVKENTRGVWTHSGGSCAVSGSGKVTFALACCSSAFTFLATSIYISCLTVLYTHTMLTVTCCSVSMLNSSCKLEGDLFSTSPSTGMESSL